MLHGKKKQPFHLMSNAFGPGLVEAIKDTPANFSISVPSDFKDAPKLSISGPNDDCKFNIQKDANGLYNVTYTPKNAGDYEISITVGGEPIEGSSFKVPVLLQESLGGEGLIRVFYSTTSSTAKGRSDVKNLEKLLVEKKVHLRKNFEPWHAVDIMDRPDREAVFRRAGTRNLPIVFVNDEYIGDYDAVSALEEAGKLDRILNLSDRDMVTLEQHMERLKAAAE
jgi:glutaredoxin